MRGEDTQQDAMFSYLSPEQRVPHDHPLRRVRALVDEVLKKLSRRFTALYARGGRPSIPPEKLLRAQLLQILYTVCCERQLMEQLDYNLLFRCFVGLDMDDSVWDPTVFTKNRQRPLDGEVAMAFLERVVEQARGGLPFCDALGVPVGPSSLTTGASSAAPRAAIPTSSCSRSRASSTALRACAHRAPTASWSG